MTSGIYAAAAGLLAEARRQDAVAQNLSNLETPGYRSERVYLAAFPELLARRIGVWSAPLGTMGTGVSVAGVRLKEGEGPIRPTGRPLDVALTEPGVFLAVQTPTGVAYTRDGQLGVDAAGYLVSAEGDRILDTALQPVRAGASATVEPDGTVMGPNGPAGRLGFFGFADPGALSPVGGGYLVPTTASGGARSVAGNCRPGYLEGANVNLGRELVTSIEAFRAYEESSQVLKAENGTLDLAVNQVGRI